MEWIGISLKHVLKGLTVYWFHVDVIARRSIPLCL